MTIPSSATPSGREPLARSPRALAFLGSFCLFSYAPRLRPRPALVALALGFIIAFGSGALASRLTRNYTPSLPRGVYWLRPSLPIAVGDVVDLPIPSSYRAFLHSRGYLPDDFHLLKRVVALPGDHVCLSDGRYEVNGVFISTIARADSLGRPLLPYRFCAVVPSGFAFLATAAPSSLDSRYFGPVPIATLTFARLLWTS